MINAYYFCMSIYGWYIWTRKVDAVHFTPITTMTKKEQSFSVVIFIATLVFVFGVYEYFEKWTDWTAYVDTLTPGVFFCRDVAYGKKETRKLDFLDRGRSYFCAAVLL